MAHRSVRARARDALLSVVDPRVGAVDNAYDAVRADRLAAQERRLVTLALALTAGPSSWTATADTSADADRRHGVIGYEGDADLLAHLAPYVVDGLVAGEACVVIATAGHLSGLRRRLAISGFVDTEGLLVEVDAEQLVSAFMTDGWPDAGLFDLHVGDVLRTHLRDGIGLRAYGEMVGVLVARGDVPAALHLEKLWDGLQLELGFPLLCGYPGDELDRLAEETAARVFARHTHVVSATA